MLSRQNQQALLAPFDSSPNCVALIVSTWKKPNDEMDEPLDERCGRRPAAGNDDDGNANAKGKGQWRQAAGGRRRRNLW